jgi:nicotinate phosphoribosyltransferase
MLFSASSASCDSPLLSAAVKKSTGSARRPEGAKPERPRRAPASAWVSDENVALLTDFYELAMARAYREEGLEEEAVFSLFVRRLPPRRNFLLACGLEDALRYLETLRFHAAALESLRSFRELPKDFLRWLARFRFRGDVYAVPEGTPVFGNEPILEVVAPVAHGQLVETFLLNQIHLQTLLASKACRVVRAAAGRPVVDFGLRRMHGTDAGVKAARAFAVAGVEATSNVLAGRLYGIPVTGTMAHSYVQAHDTEEEAFREFARIYPETVLLVDTYDTLRGVEEVARLGRDLGRAFRVRAIRLDSGNLAVLAARARQILDRAGLSRIGIFASGGLDEYRIARLVAAGAPVSGFGVGTAMGVSEDEPALDIAYKLTSYAGRGRIKLSQGKRLLPGRKQIFRVEEEGRAVADVIAAHDEEPAGRPLLEKVMEAGRRLPAGRRDWRVARERAMREMAGLPERVLAIERADPPYPVGTSARLRRYFDSIARGFVSGARREPDSPSAGKRT